MVNKKIKLPAIELKAPSNKKRSLKGNLVDRSEIPKEFQDFNRFSDKNQSKYIGSKRKLM